MLKSKDLGELKLLSNFRYLVMLSFWDKEVRDKFMLIL